MVKGCKKNKFVFTYVLFVDPAFSVLCCVYLDGTIFIFISPITRL